MSRCMWSMIVGDVVEERNTHPRREGTSSSRATSSHHLVIADVPAAPTDPSPIIPPTPVAPREGSQQCSTFPPPPLQPEQRESTPAHSFGTQRGGEDPSVWRWRRFHGVPSIPSSVNFLNDPHSARIVLRGVQYDADTATACNMTVGNQLCSLNHGLMKPSRTLPCQ